MKNAIGEVVVLVHGLRLDFLTMLVPGLYLRRCGYLVELDDASGSFIHTVPVPAEVEIGVIAGAKGDGKGWKRYMDGDDDGKVAVKDTHLPTEKDHIVIPAWQ